MQQHNQWRNPQRGYDEQDRYDGHEQGRYEDQQPQDYRRHNQQRQHGAYEGYPGGSPGNTFNSPSRDRGGAFEQDYRGNSNSGGQRGGYESRGYRDDQSSYPSQGDGRGYGRDAGSYGTPQGFGDYRTYGEYGYGRGSSGRYDRSDIDQRGGLGAGYRTNSNDYGYGSGYGNQGSSYGNQGSGYGNQSSGFADRYQPDVGSRAGYTGDEYRRYGGGFYGNQLLGGTDRASGAGTNRGFYGGQFSGYDFDRQPKPMRNNGPKNYTRSDERIQEDVNDRLMQLYDIDVSDVEVKVSDGEVTLSGTVDSRQAKFQAEQIAEAVTGVKDVSNSLRVNRDKREKRSDSSSDESRSRNQSASSSSTTNSSTGSATGSGKRSGYSGSAS